MALTLYNSTSGVKMLASLSTIIATFCSERDSRGKHDGGGRHGHNRVHASHHRLPINRRWAR
ncbi:MAG TPA: hypothetical protein VNG51_24575 [Ktedonobacteraceae bacterium]|nr:hypothetical protein [Ktedonobacteraceae bacterium]